jgi:hypothetical protein
MAHVDVALPLMVPLVALNVQWDPLVVLQAVLLQVLVVFPTAICARIL